MFETLGVIIILFLIIGGFKMFRGCMCYYGSCGSVYEYNEEYYCKGSYPFYAIIVTSLENSVDTINKIKNLKTKNGYVIIIVNDENIYSVYTEQVKKIIKSLLSNNQLGKHHPIIAFKTSEEYKDHFLNEFPEICMLENIESLKIFEQKTCPSNDDICY